MWVVFVEGKQKWYEELRKRRVDVYCMQEVRSNAKELCGCSGRRYILWWSGNDAGSERVEILVIEKISGNKLEEKASE